MPAPGDTIETGEIQIIGDTHMMATIMQEW